MFNAKIFTLTKRNLIKIVSHFQKTFFHFCLLIFLWSFVACKTTKSRFNLLVIINVNHMFFSKVAHLSASMKSYLKNFNSIIFFFIEFQKKCFVCNHFIFEFCVWFHFFVNFVCFWVFGHVRKNLDYEFFFWTIDRRNRWWR